MADIELKLNRGSGRQTMTSLGLVRRVRVPAGSRTLVISSPQAVYWETAPDTEKLDGAAEDQLRQLRIEPGTYSMRLFGDGQTDIPNPQLARDTYYYFAPSVAAQEISFYATQVAQ